MDKITYLAELAEGLARWVPERERQDILRYYAEYFEEAGPGREAEVVAELGDPWALSCRLAVEGGYVTHEKAASWTPRKKWPRVLIGTAVGLAVFTLVFNFGLLAANVARTVSDPVRSVTVGSATEFLFEHELEEGNVAFVDGVYDACFIDGENLDTFSSIDADISFGSIEVVAGDDFTLSIRLSRALSAYVPAWEVRDGTLRLRDGGGAQVQVNSWTDLKSLFGVGQGGVELTITVPEGAVLNKVSVKTGLGDVLLWGVNAETVTAETGLGDVACYEARNVRRLGLSTGLGDVGLSLEETIGGLSIGIKTGKGDVEVDLGCLEKDCAYELDSGMGAVTVNGSYRNSKAQRRGDLPCKLNASSGMGDVNVHFN